ncbi:hypothetical protein [Adhaeribacter arboris]|uniref:hypothetical protein n=1 Tax=Adhaeribacter arboris TaxID=2072846 RepID=UPI0018EB5CCA|nr:hypothetical protein [Adhaeribacter arboris]
MAKPIRNTPVLTGKDSKNFNEIIVKSSSQKVSEEKKNQMKKLVKSVLNNSYI